MPSRFGEKMHFLNKLGVHHLAVLGDYRTLCKFLRYCDRSRFFTAIILILCSRTWPTLNLASEEMLAPSLGRPERGREFSLVFFCDFRFSYKLIGVYIAGLWPSFLVQHYKRRKIILGRENFSKILGVLKKLKH